MPNDAVRRSCSFPAVQPPRLPAVRNMRTKQRIWVSKPRPSPPDGVYELYRGPGYPPAAMPGAARRRKSGITERWQCMVEVGSAVALIPASRQVISMIVACQRRKSELAPRAAFRPPAIASDVGATTGPACTFAAAHRPVGDCCVKANRNGPRRFLERLAVLVFDLFVSREAVVNKPACATGKGANCRAFAAPGQTADGRASRRTSANDCGRFESRSPPANAHGFIAAIGTRRRRVTVVPIYRSRSVVVRTLANLRG